MPNGEEEDLDSGWTRIGRGKGHRPKPYHGIDPIVRGLTLEHLQAEFVTKSKVWRQSSCRKETLQILDRQRPEAGWNITEAICLASSSFSRDNWLSRQRSMTQFAAFMGIVQHLQSQQQQKIEVFAQDPKYTMLDRDFLTGQGIEVLDADGEGRDDLHGRLSGKALGHITSSTFIFEPYMDMSGRCVDSVLSPRPILWIGTVLQRVEKEIHKRDQEMIDEANLNHDVHTREEIEAIVASYTGLTERLKGYLASRKRYKMPVFEEEPNMLGGLEISWIDIDDHDQ